MSIHCNQKPVTRYHELVHAPIGIWIDGGHLFGPNDQRQSFGQHFGRSENNHDRLLLIALSSINPALWVSCWTWRRCDLASSESRVLIGPNTKWPAFTGAGWLSSWNKVSNARFASGKAGFPA